MSNEVNWRYIALIAGLTSIVATFFAIRQEPRRVLSRRVEGRK